MNKSYSVLMSVYKKESPLFLKQSMQSIFDQTVPTDDFVLVCDGPLTEELNKVIDEMQKKFGTKLHVVRESENHGLGHALNLGVIKCKNQLIARMDSDDYSKKDRCEKELNIFENDPEISIVGTHVAQFKDSIENITSVRKTPETNEEIVSFAKKRNPFNHPSVMFKKQAVIKAGNYSNVRFCQDYYLWIELIAKGYKGYNIQEPLVYMREDDNTFKRRSGTNYYKILKQLLRRMRELKLISTSEYCAMSTVRFCQTMMPNWMRKTAFSLFVRERVKK